MFSELFILICEEPKLNDKGEIMEEWMEDCLEADEEWVMNNVSASHDWASQMSGSEFYNELSEMLSRFDVSIKDAQELEIEGGQQAVLLPVELVGKLVVGIKKSFLREIERAREKLALYEDELKDRDIFKVPDPRYPFEVARGIHPDVGFLFGTGDDFVQGLDGFLTILIEGCIQKNCPVLFYQGFSVHR